MKPNYTAHQQILVTAVDAVARVLVGTHLHLTTIVKPGMNIPKICEYIQKIIMQSTVKSQGIHSI